MKKLSTLLLTLSTTFSGMCLGQDSVKVESKAKEPLSHVRIVTRLNSMGQFNYGGRIVSENPTVDFNFTYQRKAWGFQAFKAIDLRDPTTDINFMLAVVNKTFHLGKRLTVTPNVGFILEQNRTIADRGSDLTFILNSSYKISKSVTLEHSALLGNVALEPEEKDWVNRVRLVYSEKHWDFIAMVWHNNKVFDSAEYVTCGGGISYSRVKISDSFMLNAGVTALLMPYSNDLTNYPKKNGLVFTMAVVWN